MTTQSNETVTLYRPGKDITVVADAIAVGRRAVKVNASKVSGGNVHVIQAVAGNRPDGILAWDLASGETGAMVRDGVVFVDAGATVTTGQELEIDVTGRVITLASGKSIGKAWSDATVGNPCLVALSL
jgi:hypothetical protein